MITLLPFIRNIPHTKILNYINGDLLKEYPNKDYMVSNNVRKKLYVFQRINFNATNFN